MITVSVPPGLYRVYWKSGGMSLASVYIDECGRSWLAPTNWIAPGCDWERVWSLVDSLDQIA